LFPANYDSLQEKDGTSVETISAQFLTRTYHATGPKFHLTTLVITNNYLKPCTFSNQSGQFMKTPVQNLDE